MAQATRYTLSERLQMMLDEVKGAGLEDPSLLYELDDMKMQAIEMETQDIEAIDDYLEDVPETCETFSRREKVAAVVNALIDARHEAEEVALQLFLILSERTTDEEIPDSIEERVTVLAAMLDETDTRERVQ